MKKMILVVVYMLGTYINYANADNNAPFNDNPKRIKIEFFNVKKGHSLTIKGKQGGIIYNEEIKNTGDFSKTFDLTALKKGDYTVELNKDFEIIIKSFSVDAGNVTFLIEKQETIFKPVFRTKEDLVIISRLNFNKEPLNIVIFYDDEKIYSEIVKGKKIVKRVYKLSAKEKGDYEIVMSSNGRVFIENFKIQ
jgi:hypothetical protein